MEETIYLGLIDPYFRQIECVQDILHQMTQ